MLRIFFRREQGAARERERERERGTDTCNSQQDLLHDVCVLFEEPRDTSFSLVLPLSVSLSFFAGRAVAILLKVNRFFSRDSSVDRRHNMVQSHRQAS
jgi:hypothetical protein